MVETLWDLANVLWDVGTTIYHYVAGDNDAAKSDIVDLSLDVTATLVPGLPAGTTKLTKTIKSVHGNSKNSTRCQHVYDIYKKSDGKVVKTGIRGGKVSKKGKSPDFVTQKIHIL